MIEGNFSFELNDYADDYKIQIDYQEPINSNMTLAYFFMYGLPCIFGIYFILSIMSLRYCYKMRQQRLERITLRNFVQNENIHETPV